MGKRQNISTEKQRYDFIDVLRIAACFFVIVNHTCSMIFVNTTPSVNWFVSLIYFYISKLSVPVFVMISGYTMLDKRDDYKKSLQRVLRVVLALCVFSFGYYMFQWWLGDRPVIGFFDFFVVILKNPLSLAYWYLYMYIGLLIMMPFLQKFVAGLNKKDCEIFIVISLFVFGTWPIIVHWFPALEVTSLVDLACFDSYIAMLMIGYYIKKYVTPSKKLFIVSAITFVVCVAFNVIMTYHEYLTTGGGEYLFYDDRVYLPIVLQGASFFYMATHLSLKGKVAKVLKVVGSCTFGIYLVADFLISITQSIYFYLCTKGITPMISMIIYEIVIFVVGLAMVLVMKKIPLLKKLL